MTPASSEAGGASKHEQMACVVVPHAVPFLFVDRTLSIGPKSARVLRVVTRNDAALRGYETMPASILVEAVAQAAGVLIVGTRGSEPAGALTAIDSFEFHRPIRSGERMEIEVEMRRVHAPFVSIAGRILVDGEVRARGRVTLSSGRSWMFSGSPEARGGRSSDVETAG